MKLSIFFKIQIIINLMLPYEVKMFNLKHLILFLYKIVNTVMWRQFYYDTVGRSE